MAELSPQQPSDYEAPSSTKDALTQDLDGLIERYLHLLDHHQSLQQAFTKTLSSGFLDLARANFSNPNRIRYGQDFYDERMQAATQVNFNASKPLFSIDSRLSRAEDKNSPVDLKSIAASSTEESCEPENIEAGKKALQDPIKWFGLLVPPALRSSQAYFRGAVGDNIPALVNVDNEMKEVEIEIRRTRKRLAHILSTRFERAVDMESRSQALASIPDLAPYEELYKHFHSHPELSIQEHETASTVAKHLRSFNAYSVQTDIGGTGLVGVLKNGDGKTVLLRADMDALPVEEQTGLEYASKVTVLDKSDGATKPVMHACGHDMHITCLLATAETLAKTKDLWKGTLIVLFQPNEERGGGAKAMVEDGLYDKVPVPDFVLGQHVMALRAGIVGAKVGTIMASSNRFKITLFGRGGHGSMPHRTIDPAVLAANVVVRLQTIVSREVDPSDMAVVTVASLQAGQTENIIADVATLKVDVRAIKPQTRGRVIKAIRRIVKAECDASGCPREAVIEEITVFPLTVNDEKLTKTVTAAFQDHFGSSCEADTERTNASEDVTILGSCRDRPCMYWFFGGVDHKTWDDAEKNGTLHEAIPVNHSPFFAPVIQPTMRTGVEALILAAFTLLQ